MLTFRRHVNGGRSFVYSRRPSCRIANLTRHLHLDSQRICLKPSNFAKMSPSSTRSSWMTAHMSSSRVGFNRLAARFSLCKATITLGVRVFNQELKRHHQSDTQSKPNCIGNALNRNAWLPNKSTNINLLHFLCAFSVGLTWRTYATNKTSFVRVSVPSIFRT